MQYQEYKLAKKKYKHLGIQPNVKSVQNLIDYDPAFDRRDNFLILHENEYFGLPAEFATISTEELRNTVQFLFEELVLHSESPNNQKIFDLLPGDTKCEKIENFKSMINNPSQMMFDPIDIFRRQKENGVFTRTYQTEKNLQKKLDQLEYEETILSNIDTHYKTRKRNLLRKRTPKIQSLMKNSIDFNKNTFECDTESEERIQTSKADENSEEDDDEDEDTPKIKEIKERIINTSRRADTVVVKEQKTQKNVVTVKKSSPEWIANFRNQETQRYENPMEPWEYTLQDGSPTVVAPVSKKSISLTSKARDHVIFKRDRPPFITILCLVRDAASKLPGGKGTRADIVQLLKESQYVNVNLNPRKISGIVSGALDRLHYETDPCVKYDIETKMWIYLHMNRVVSWPGWKEEFPSEYKDPQQIQNLNLNINY